MAAFNLSLIFFAFIVSFTSAKILVSSNSNRDTFSTSGAGTESKANPISSSTTSRSIENREKFLADDSFTLGYATKYNYGYGGIGGIGYPGHGYYGGGRPYFGHIYRGGYTGFGHNPYIRPYYNQGFQGGILGGGGGYYGYKHHYQGYQQIGYDYPDHRYFHGSLTYY